MAQAAKQPTEDRSVNEVARDPIAVAAELMHRIAELSAVNADMLAALHRCVEVIEFAYMNAPEQPKELAEARAAIAKAEGRS